MRRKRRLMIFGNASRGTCFPQQWFSVTQELWR